MTHRSRFLVALVAAMLSAAVCILTLVEPQWFELLFESSPDGGDGSLETLVAVAVSALAGVVSSVIGWREWKRDRRDEKRVGSPEPERAGARRT